MNATTLLEYLPCETDSVKGWALLEFELPNGQIAGASELWIPSRGRPRLRLRLEQFRAEPPYDESPVAFLAGTEPTVCNGVRSFSIGGRECRFTSLLLETDSGTYSATAGIVQADQIYPTVESVTADIMDLVFTPKEVRHPRFWLATLHASCSEFAMRRPASHVLAFADRLLYPFQDSERSYAFQPLTYEGESCNVPYDAVMFGEVGTPFDLSSTIAVLPTGILNALAFGVGSAVEMSTLELRDADGYIARREFFSTSTDLKRTGTPCFTVFNTGVGSGISAFLTKFLSLPTGTRIELVPAITLVLSGSPGSRQPIEDSLTFLIRALDSLVRSHKMAQQNLLDLLDGEMRDRVRHILRDASGQIARLQASSSVDSLPTSVLNRIKGRVENAATTDRNFGVALRILAERYSLNDFKVLEKNFSGYEGLLSMMRGQVVHEGHLNIKTRTQLRAWFEFALYLHDLTKRLILRAISYEGTYQASNKKFLGPSDLDWVKAEMAVEQLGFSRGLPKLPQV